MLRSTHVTIRRDALRNNIELARRCLDPKTKLLAVIKANAYGHGIVEVGQYLQANRLADYLAVAIVEEGVKLRQNGVHLPILVLGATDDEHLSSAIENDLSLAIFTTHSLLALQAEAKRSNKQAKIHIKIDSGMHRIGIQTEQALCEFISVLATCPNILIEGIFTHFAMADTSDVEYTNMQAYKFHSMVRIVNAAGYNPIVHCCNSGGIFQHSQFQDDMVRLGISLYGCPINDKAHACHDLMPVLSWQTCVVNLFTLQAGQSLSYGLRYTTDRPIKVATLAVGYGDGYKRCLTNKAEVLIGGRRCKQIGTICMDQMMVDVSDVPDVAIGSEVVLIGTQGNETITADQIAEWAGTISYEILLSISERVPRIYR